MKRVTKQMSSRHFAHEVPHVQTDAQLCKTVTHDDAEHFGVELKCIGALYITYEWGIFQL